jgi:hypothetical protein
MLLMNNKSIEMIFNLRKKRQFIIWQEKMHIENSPYAIIFKV